MRWFPMLRARLHTVSAPWAGACGVAILEAVSSSPFCFKGRQT